jgi:hypothetical protein
LKGAFLNEFLHGKYATGIGFIANADKLKAAAGEAAANEG